MTVTHAFRNGIRRVNNAPSVLAGVFAVTVAAALPLAVALRQSIGESLAGRLASVSASRGVDVGWWQEFAAGAGGIAKSFSATIIGGAAVLDNLGAMVDNDGHLAPLVAAGAAYILAWIFLAGGILDRFARDRATGSAGFFAACGVFFFRFARLSVIAGALYGLMFAFLHPLLFGLYARQARDLTVEREAFLLYVAVAVLFGAMLSLVNLVFDYAKVRAVVEDRRSMALSLGAAIRFVRRHPRSILLYLLNGCVFVLVVALYLLLAPSGTAPTWVVLLAGQVYILARLWVKLLFYASATAFFEGSLGHAGHLRRPAATWPDSPAAEAIIVSSTSR
ncbi:MAG: hypothetical protein ACM3NQ_13500 [Bacteroidales bacterium]